MVHTPALLKEVIEYLNPKPGDQIIDATLDGGGHALAIAEQIAPNGKVLGIELDPVLFKEVKSVIRNTQYANMIIFVNDSYVNIENIVREYNFKPNGILFDLGLSSWHYEKSGRGFSFRKDEPLDMRYNPSNGSRPLGEARSKGAAGQAAAEIVNMYSKEALEKIIREYGEEQFSKNIARNIVSVRNKKPITTTGELVEIISNSVPDWYKKQRIHFATRTFQALRIVVNDELKNVNDGIISAINVLEPDGRLVVISFHGLEDKIVREIFKMKIRDKIITPLIKRTIRPSWEEIKTNSRARSAKLKAIKKV